MSHIRDIAKPGAIKDRILIRLVLYLTIKGTIKSPLLPNIKIYTLFSTSDLNLCVIFHSFRLLTDFVCLYTYEF